MTLKTILVPVRGDGKGEGVMDHAVALAKRFGAHVDVIHARARAADMLPYGVLMTQSMKETILEASKTQAETEEARVRELFDTYCATNSLSIIEPDAASNGDVTVSWREVTGKQADLIGLEGRVADLIAVPQPEGDLGVRTLEGALMESGTKVLMCPAKPVSELGQNIAVCWNGGAEATRAIKSSMDLLRDAAKVSILTNDPGGERHDVPSARLVRYMARHGIDAVVQDVSGGDEPVGARLLAAAHAAGADMMIMGAYSHSRQRELVMGGATRHIVKNAALPVLMLH